MSRRGVSLLEILIASGIMVAAMVPLWGLMGTSHKQVTLSADEIRVSQLAVEILEQIENHGWKPVDGDYPVEAESGSKINLGSGNDKIEVQIGSYPEYLALNGKINVTRYPPLPRAESGKIMRLMLNYKSKEQVGEEIKNYELSTFVNGN